MSENNATHIEALLAQLRVEFLQELPSRIVALENLVLQKNSEENYQEIFRRIHNLKGSGSTHGIDILSFACHQLEEALQQHGQDHVLSDSLGKELLLSYLDILRLIQKQAAGGQSNYTEIRETLQNLRLRHSGEKAEVLVVEPTTTSSQLISESLAQLPVHITCTDSGLAGLELLLHRKFHIVISAMETSALSGTALIASVKSTPQYEKDTICILISSNPHEFESSNLTPDYVLHRDTELWQKLHDIVANFLGTTTIKRT